jgi:hypothetical protein
MQCHKTINVNSQVTVSDFVNRTENYYLAAKQKSVLCSYDILVTVSNAPKRECDVEVT